jgi:hypothetical protein
MNLVNFVGPVNSDNRFHRNAGCLHVDQQEADALLFARYIGRGADQTENPVRELRQRSPEFRAVDDEVVTIPVGAGLERRQIGSASGFRVSLAPPHIAFEDIGQKSLLLLLSAEGVNNRANHAQAEWNDIRHVGIGHLGIENVFLYEAPASAAVFDGPVRRSPSFLKQRFLESDLIFGFQRDMLCLFVVNILWDLIFKKCPDLVSKGEFFGGERYVHINSGSLRDGAEKHAA